MYGWNTQTVLHGSYDIFLSALEIMNNIDRPLIIDLSV